MDAIISYKGKVLEENKEVFDNKRYTIVRKRIGYVEKSEILGQEFASELILSLKELEENAWTFSPASMKREIEDSLAGTPFLDRDSIVITKVDFKL